MLVDRGRKNLARNSKMSAFDKDSDSLWERFDQLASVSESERLAAYRADGPAFLELLVSKLMVKYALPVIDNASDFSEVILALRENYRQWNQRLVGLLAEFQSGKQISVRRELIDFTQTCPWNGLADVVISILESN